jgi:hypothetical protein
MTPRATPWAFAPLARGLCKMLESLVSRPILARSPWRRLATARRREFGLSGRNHIGRRARPHVSAPSLQSLSHPEPQLLRVSCWPNGTSDATLASFRPGKSVDSDAGEWGGCRDLARGWSFWRQPGAAVSSPLTFSDAGAEIFRNVNSERRRRRRHRYGSR